jgi:hypothetical protein
MLTNPGGQVHGGELCVVTPSGWTMPAHPPYFDVEPVTLKAAVDLGRVDAPGFIKQPGNVSLTCDSSQGYAVVGYGAGNLVLSTQQV